MRLKSKKNVLKLENIFKKVPMITQSTHQKSSVSQTESEALEQ
jgi:hypothetical protein